MSDENIKEVVTEILQVDPGDTQPLANIPERGKRHWVPSVWKPAGSGGGAPKISGGFEADNKTGAAVPRSFNRPDQRYSEAEAVLQAKRDARASSEYPSSVILIGAGGIYEVRSASGNNYDVKGDLSACDCPDWLRLQASGKTGVSCKHQLLVGLALADTGLPQGVPWSCDKAAEFVGIDVQTVRQACAKGIIPAVKVHNVWVIQPLDGSQLKLLYTYTKPTLTGITPNSAAHGSASTPVVLDGTDINAYSRLVWDNQTVVLPTSFTSTTMNVTIPAVLLTLSGVHSVKIENAYPGGGTSDALTFTVI